MHRLKLMKYLIYCPVFTPDSPEDFFSLFERIATFNKFPKEKWFAMCYSKLSSDNRASAAVLQIRENDLQDYDVLKEKVLQIYARQPEFYRKKFRTMSKSNNETYCDFEHNLRQTMRRWLESVRCYNNINQLRETILLERFYAVLPPELRQHIIDKEPDDLHVACELADKYVLTHKSSASE